MKSKVIRTAVCSVLSILLLASSAFAAMPQDKAFQINRHAVSSEIICIKEGVTYLKTGAEITLSIALPEGVTNGSLGIEYDPTVFEASFDVSGADVGISVATVICEKGENTNFPVQTEGNKIAVINGIHQGGENADSAGYLGDINFTVIADTSAASFEAFTSCLVVGVSTMYAYDDEVGDFFPVSIAASAYLANTNGTLSFIITKAFPPHVVLMFDYNSDGKIDEYDQAVFIRNNARNEWTAYTKAISDKSGDSIVDDEDYTYLIRCILKEVRYETTIYN